MKYKVVIFYVCADDLAETIKGTCGKLERRKQSTVGWRVLLPLGNAFRTGWGTAGQEPEQRPVHRCLESLGSCRGSWRILWLSLIPPPSLSGKLDCVIRHCLSLAITGSCQWTVMGRIPLLACNCRFKRHAYFTCWHQRFMGLNSKWNRPKIIYTLGS